MARYGARHTSAHVNLLCPCIFQPNSIGCPRPIWLTPESSRLQPFRLFPGSHDPVRARRRGAAIFPRKRPPAPGAPVLVPSFLGRPRPLAPAPGGRAVPAIRGCVLRPCRLPSALAPCARRPAAPAVRACALHPHLPPARPRRCGHAVHACPLRLRGCDPEQCAVSPCPAPCSQPAAVVSLSGCPRVLPVAVLSQCLASMEMEAWSQAQAEGKKEKHRT